ncbi:MAG: VCBS repeat-containing protein [Saprospiraceae bacterium]|nr:VCBS repeat-containing protein [Saprospiraceae bacterium]
MKRFLVFSCALFSLIRAEAQSNSTVIIDTIQDSYSNFLPYDWDHDGDFDFVGTTGLGFHLSWMENTGGDLPEKAVVIDTAFYYNRPLFTDFNGDNLTDMVFNGFDSGGFDNSLVIRLQLANGQFGSHVVAFPHSNDFRDFTLADFDNDGDVDFARADESALLWYENDGNGNFEPPHFIADPTGGVLHAADLNADGLTDLLVTDAPEGKIWYFEALDGGNFNPKILAASLPDWLDRLASDDLDGDDLPDLLPVYRYDEVFTYGQAWLKNLGGGLFAAPQPLDPAAGLPYIVQELVTGDIDNDGDVDVIASCTRGDSLIWFENAGSGLFSEHLLAVYPESTDLTNMLLADYDGDGLPDLFGLAVGTDFFKNEGGGQFAPRHTILPKFYSIKTADLADLDHDGLTDIIALSDYDGKLFWYPNLGGGQFGKHQEISHTNYGGAFAHAADLDGDGDLDVLSGIPKKSANISPQAYELVWYENDGTGAFGDDIRVFPAGFYFPVAMARVADLDGDGDKDIACLYTGATQTLAWLPNDGAGGFGTPKFISPGDVAGQFILTDLDGDSTKTLWRGWTLPKFIGTPTMGQAISATCFSSGCKAISALFWLPKISTATATWTFCPATIPPIQAGGTPTTATIPSRPRSRCRQNRSCSQPILPTSTRTANLTSSAPTIMRSAGSPIWGMGYWATRFLSTSNTAVLLMTAKPLT